MRKKGLILLGVALLIMSRNTYAEEDQYGGVKDIELGPITVTASRIERRLSEVPSSISIISKKDIQSSNAKSIPDLLKGVEGIDMYDSSGVGTSGRINMRGFWGGMSTHQLLLIDGIPQNRAEDKLEDWNTIPLNNVERIEVLRGPASALYGDNAMSGVINIITKKPSATSSTSVAASYGSYNTQNYGFSASSTFKKIGYYLGVSRKWTDGFRRHCDYEDIHVNGKLDFSVFEKDRIILSLGHHENEIGAYPWALTEAQIAQDRRQARPGSENDKSKAQKNDVAVTYNKDVGGISNFDGTLYYRYEDGESFYTGRITPTREQLENEDTYGLLLRYNINPRILGLEQSLTIGADLERNNFDYNEYNAPFQVRGSLRSDYFVQRDKVGPYLQEELNLCDPLKFIAGLRYDSVKFDFDDRKTAANSKKSKMSKFTPKYALVYTYKGDSSIYTNYSKAFRTPTIGQMFTYSTANPDLNPEETVNYEMGIRHRFDEYARAHVSLYWIELDNEIWYDNASEKHLNYGKTSHKGVESSFDFKINEGLIGYVHYTYTRAKNENGAYAGEYLANIPIHKWGLGLQAQTKSGLKANLNINKIGSMYIDSENNNKLSGYTTIDTKVSYEYKGWSTFLGVDNLFNETYNSYGYTSGGTRYFNPAPGRTFTIGAEVNF